MFKFAKRCLIQLKDVWVKRCGNKRWGSGNNFAKQEVMSLGTQSARKLDRWKQNSLFWSSNLASRYIKVFHGIKPYDYESTATTKRHSYSVRFFRRRIRRNFLKCHGSNYEKSKNHTHKKLIAFDEGERFLIWWVSCER